MDMAKGPNSGKKDRSICSTLYLGRREESKTACGVWGSLLAWPLLLLCSSCKGISARKHNTRTNQAEYCAMHASTFPTLIKDDSHGRERERNAVGKSSVEREGGGGVIRGPT
jgi:hypothetical protein